MKRFYALIHCIQKFQSLHPSFSIRKNTEVSSETNGLENHGGFFFLSFSVLFQTDDKVND